MRLEIAYDYTIVGGSAVVVPFDLAFMVTSTISMMAMRMTWM